MFKECGITPHYAGFGMYQREEANGEDWEDEGDLIDAMQEGAEGELLELGKDKLPEGLEDIRGKIYDEPDRVFGKLDENDVPCYYGIVRVS